MVTSEAPSNETEPERSPPRAIVLEVCKADAVSALPVKEPMKLVAVTTPVTKTSPPTVSFASVAAVPIPTSALESAAILIYLAPASNSR